MSAARFSIDLRRFAEAITWCNTDLPQEAVKAAADRTRDALLETFDSQQDPYERPWVPRRHDRPWPILNRTGNLRGSIEVQPEGNVLRIRANADHASYHQRGTRYLPVRQIVPSGVTPDRIVRILKEAVDELVAGRFT